MELVCELGRVGGAGPSGTQLPPPLLASKWSQEEALGSGWLGLRVPRFKPQHYHEAGE